MALQESLDPLVLDLVELAVGEACANAVEHGAPNGILSQFILRCYKNDSEPAVIFEVTDEGADFPLPDEWNQQTPDLFSEGGRGLFLISQIMDDFARLPDSRGLTVRMTKSLEPAK
jgi:anti-sigma regulatory factor (Ser/Thr protein kinase)